MIKLIASDLDGTLIPEGTQEIEPGFFEVLSELLDQGYQFYVATGRQYANVRRLFSDYADRIGFVCENGALANFKDPIDNGINAQSIIFPVSDRIYRILIQTICNGK